MGKRDGFHGHWATNHGRLELAVCGDRVIGTYPVAGATIDGTVSGDVLEGTWRDYSGHGTLRLELGPEGTISGTWARLDGPGGESGEWHGVVWTERDPVTPTASTMPFLEQIE
jgi:hypothetical protein